MFEGKNSVLDGSSTVGPIAGARPVDGLRMRETASEREACEEKSQDILRKVRQATEIWNQRRKKITQAARSHTKGPVVKSTKVKIDASFKMADRGFHKQDSRVGVVAGS